MKIYLFTIILLICASGNIYSQTAREYLPFRTGETYYYKYVNPKDENVLYKIAEITEKRTKCDSVWEKDSVTYLKISHSYIYEQEESSSRTGDKYVYSISRDEVWYSYDYMFERHPNTNLLFKLPPANQPLSWEKSKYVDKQLFTFKYKAEYLDTMTVNNKLCKDVLVFTEQEFLGGGAGTLPSPNYTKKSYYAKNIGLVSFDYLDKNNRLDGTRSYKLKMIDINQATS